MIIGLTDLIGRMAEHRINMGGIDWHVPGPNNTTWFYIKITSDSICIAGSKSIYKVTWK